MKDCRRVMMFREFLSLLLVSSLLPPPGVCMCRCQSTPFACKDAVWAIACENDDQNSDEDDNELDDHHSPCSCRTPEGDTPHSPACPILKAPLAHTLRAQIETVPDEDSTASIAWAL
jgi:hypothetical protein